MACLDSARDISRTWHAREGPNTSRIFLRHRAGCSLADQKLAAAISAGAFCRARNHVRHSCGMGCSICQDHDDGAGDAQMVNSIQRTSQGHQLPIFKLDPKCPSRLGVFSAVAHPGSVHTFFKISRRYAATTCARPSLGNAGTVPCRKSCAWGGRAL